MPTSEFGEKQKINTVLELLQVAENDKIFLQSLETANATASDEDYQKLRQIILNLFPLTDIIKKPYALVPFRQEFDEELYRLKVRKSEDLANCVCLAWWANLADKSMTGIYFLFIAAGLAYSIAVLAGFNIPIFSTSLFQTASDDFWNYHDAAAGMVLGIYQILNGQGAIGWINFLSSAQITAFTFAGSRQIMFNIWLVSAALSGAFLGFSFAVSMFAGFVIELIELYRIDKFTEELKVKYREFINCGGKQDSQEAKNFREQIQQSEANAKNHTNNCYVWLACTLAMTIIASAALLTALTGGGFLAVGVIAAVGGLLSASIRIHLTTDWFVKVGKMLSLDLAKKDFVTELTETKYAAKVQAAYKKFDENFLDNKCELTFKQEKLTLNLDDKVYIGFCSELFKIKQKSMREHIHSLIKPDPLKADRLLLALKNHDLKSFEHEIKTGDKEGRDIYKELTKPVAPTSAPAPEQGEDESGAEQPH